MEIQNLSQKLKEAEQYIAKHVEIRPKIAITLGSGLNKFANNIEKKKELSCEEIPHYPVPTVDGHDGKLVFGELSGIDILGIKGRSHFYEGKTLQKIVFPIDLVNSLEISQLILTNAAGGINTNLTPTDLVLIDSYLNFTQITRPFLDSETLPFDDKLNQLALNVANKLNIDLKTGTYCWTTGPNFETWKEIEVASKLEADTAGMSTVPELQRAAYYDLDVIGISLITNMAAGINDSQPSHQEVNSVANQSEQKFYNFATSLIKNLDKRKPLI